MPRDDAVGEEVKIVISLVVKGVIEQKTTSGARGELVRSSGESVRRAGTTKNSKVSIGGSGAIQGHMRGGVTYSHGRKTVEEMGSSVQVLFPIAGRKSHMKKEATDHVSGDANNPFGLVNRERSFSWFNTYIT